MTEDGVEVAGDKPNACIPSNFGTSILLTLSFEVLVISTVQRLEAGSEVIEFHAKRIIEAK